METARDRQPDRLTASALIALGFHGALLLAFALLGDLAPAIAPVPVSVTLESPRPLVETPGPPPEPRSAEPARATAPREQLATTATAPREQPAVAVSRAATVAPAGAQPGAASAPAELRRTTTEALRRALSSLPEDRASASSADDGAAAVPLLPRATTHAADLPPPPFVPNEDASAGRAGTGAAPRGPAAAQAPAASVLPLGEWDAAARARGDTGRAAPAGAGAASGPGQPAAANPTGPQITWEDQGAVRKQLTSAEPEIPEWVKRDALTLRLVVAFDVAPSGLVSSVAVERSSGFADVDAAVLEAVRRWRFESAGTNRTVRGSVPYVITQR